MVGWRGVAWAAVFCGGALGCDDDDKGGLASTGDAGAAVHSLRLTSVASGLSQPTFVAPLPGTDVLLVLEQGGKIRRVENGELSEEPFLDLTARIVSGGERGLLGLAFHPDFAENGRLFVHYSANTEEPGAGIRRGDGIISEFVSNPPGALTADPGSERRLLSISQPYSNHNGGMLAFSPRDGFLYIGLGDGGSGGDPEGNGQNLSSWLGKMLRIDVDSRSQGEYGIPDGNMTGEGVLPEIWSYGWRNPWRFSFDAANGDLYVGDVGQDSLEEVDYEPSGVGGRNYGWKVMEASRCFRSGSGCDQQGLTLPVAEYSHQQGCSITGGYVYRGQAIADLAGTYLYADYCSGRFGSLRIENRQLVAQQDITATINPGNLTNFTSFGVDGQGELYVLDGGGTLHRITAE
ncbi:MAG TPA: PQQ-dependent sugar dehydrogenase [Polyangiaceae bacterium]|nr:PQQ-dependent sugar dehydrogenase [Polyangiaceae bacterium]